MSVNPSLDLGSLTAYVGGPITKKPDMNRAAFREAVDILRAEGYGLVIAPVFMIDQTAQEADSENLTYDEARKRDPYRQALRAALNVVLNQADHIFMLPGYERSVGSRDEIRLAQAIGVPIFDYATRNPLPVEASVRLARTDISIQIHDAITFDHPRDPLTGGPDYG